MLWVKEKVLQFIEPFSTQASEPRRLGLPRQRAVRRGSKISKNQKHIQHPQQYPHLELSKEHDRLITEKEKHY